MKCEYRPVLVPIAAALTFTACAPATTGRGLTYVYNAVGTSSRVMDWRSEA